MGRLIEDKVGAAFAMGKLRQQINLVIALFFINILIMFILKSSMLGFNIAMFIICGVAYWANSAVLKKIEKESGLKEEDLATFKIK